MLIGTEGCSQRGSNHYAPSKMLSIAFVFSAASQKHSCRSSSVFGLNVATIITVLSLKITAAAGSHCLAISGRCSDQLQSPEARAAVPPHDQVVVHRAITLAILTGIGGAAAVQTLHAQGAPPVNYVADVEIANHNDCNKEYVAKPLHSQSRWAGRFAPPDQT